MTKLVGLHPEQISLSPSVWVLPGVGAIGMPPADQGTQTNTNFNAVPGATTIKFDANPRGQHRRNVDARGLFFSDYAGRPVPALNVWYLNRFPNQEVTMPLTTYSCRFYFTPWGGYEGYFPGAFTHLITFKEGGLEGTDRFSLIGSDSPLGTEWQWLRPIVKGELNSDTLVSASGGQMGNWTTWRIEIQVKPVADVTGTKLTIKIYDWDSTTPWRTITCNPANVAADSFLLGRHPQKTIVVDGNNVVLPSKCGPNWFVSGFWIGDLEVFDTYDLDGTVGQHRQTPVNKWSEMVNGVEIDVVEEGTIGPTGTINLTDKNNWHDNYREFSYDSSNYTVESFYYDYPARPVRGGLIYYRNDTAPSGGWPLISFWHGGFYAGGTLYDVNLEWVKWLLYNGFAVTTGEWIVGRALINYPLSLATWPNQYSGRYPSFYIDPKLLALTTVDRGRQGNGDWPINTDKTCIVGHSAGAGIAVGAAVSRDLILGPYDLTVNNPTYGSRTNTPDPTFKCCYVWSPPTDMKWAYDNDPTHPEFGVLNNRVGILRATACTYMGLPYNTTLTNEMMENTRVTEMVAAQTPSKIPPIGVVTAINDGVVPYQHTELLEAALNAKGLSADLFYTKHDHNASYIQGPQQHFLNFLEENGMR